MILPVQHKANWAAVTQSKQNMMNESNAKENESRLPCEHEAGDQVLLNKPGILPKMVAPRTGPYTLVAVNDNGT